MVRRSNYGTWGRGVFLKEIDRIYNIGTESLVWTYFLIQSPPPFGHMLFSYNLKKMVKDEGLIFVHFYIMVILNTRLYFVLLFPFVD